MAMKLRRLGLARVFFSLREAPRGALILDPLAAALYIAGFKEQAEEALSVFKWGPSSWS